VLGVLGRRRAAGGEHRLLEVLHVTVPPPKPIPSAGSVRLAKLLMPRRGSAGASGACAAMRNSVPRRIYLQGIDPEEIITAVRTRRAPMMSASAGLLL
jgi:hypothetical protein